MTFLRLGLFFLLLPCIASAQREPYVLVLGIAQDGGYPHAGCKRSCCAKAWKDRSERRLISSLALIDPQRNEAWLFDVTPGFTEQLHLLQQRTNDSIRIAGIFLTHAHIGHYTGLVFLGREAIASRNIPVYAMPRMKTFLESNGPWSQLVQLGNIALHELHDSESVEIAAGLKVTPLRVPHRDEFSETVGFRISHGSASMLFIPDIDKWEKWERSIAAEVQRSTHAFIDGTFFSPAELPGRNLAEIPHPLVPESMRLLQPVKTKVHFIHLNHSNPLLGKGSEEYRKVIAEGFSVAEETGKYTFREP